MTTGGEGGMVTTNSDELFEKMWAYKDHGKSRLKMENSERNRRFKYVHDSFGANFRLTEMQSALGYYQLGQLDRWKAERTNNAMFYQRHLSSVNVVRSVLPPENVEHAYYKFYFFIELAKLAKGWDRIVEEISDCGGSCFSGSYPELYEETAFVAAYGNHEGLKNAMKLGHESVILTCHPGLSEKYLAYNADIVSQLLLRATNDTK